MTSFFYNTPTVCKPCAFLNNADSGSDTDPSNSLYIILLSWNDKVCMMICRVNIFIILRVQSVTYAGLNGNQFLTVSAYPGKRNVIYIYIIQFVSVDTQTSTPSWARHWTLQKLLWWRVSTGECGWSGDNFYFLSRNVEKSVYFHKLAPQSVFYRH